MRQHCANENWRIPISAGAVLALRQKGMPTLIAGAGICDGFTRKFSHRSGQLTVEYNDHVLHKMWLL